MKELTSLAVEAEDFSKRLISLDEKKANYLFKVTVTSIYIFPSSARLSREIGSMRREN